MGQGMNNIIQKFGILNMNKFKKIRCYLCVINSLLQVMEKIVRIVDTSTKYFYSEHVLIAGKYLVIWSE